MIIFAFKKEELKEKTQDANFSLPIKNPNPLFKNGFRIRIPKFTKKFPDSDTDCQPYFWNQISLTNKKLFYFRGTDNLIVVGHVQGDLSTLEVYVYNDVEDAFYVHHDLVLPSFPLALGKLMMLHVLRYFLMLCYIRL